MTKKELLKKLKLIVEAGNCDMESSHLQADEALLEYINDPKITEAFQEIEKWYS